jgi:hypothetical protein
MVDTSPPWLGWHAAGQIGADGFHASANVICLIVAGPANYFVTPNLENQIECSQNFMICQTLVLTFVGTGSTSVLFVFETSAWTFEPAVRPFSIMILLVRLCMQFRASFCLVLRAYCLSMDTTLCSSSPCAPCLLSAYGCSFVLCACYTIMDTTLCSTPAAAFVSLLAHTRRPLCPRGSHSPTLPCCACSWNTCNIKHLLQHRFGTDETFITYVCNICVWTP